MGREVFSSIDAKVVPDGEGIRLVTAEKTDERFASAEEAISTKASGRRRELVRNGLVAVAGAYAVSDGLNFLQLSINSFDQDPIGAVVGAVVGGLEMVAGATAVFFGFDSRLGNKHYWQMLELRRARNPNYYQEEADQSSSVDQK